MNEIDRVIQTQIDHMASGYCYESYHGTDISVNGVDLIVRPTTQGLFIAVRGTEPTFSEWWRNLRLWPFSAGKFYFHSGFWKGAEGVLPEVIKTLSNVGYYRDIYVCGHSQGAGVGFCLARQLKKRGHEVRGFIGFGMPKTMSRVKGDFDFGFDFRHYRNGDDPVPKWTPPGVLYKHPVPYIQLDSIFSINGVHDHSMYQYRVHMITRQEFLR